MARNASSDKSVVRISAKDESASKKAAPTKQKKAKAQLPKDERKERGGVLGYFVGAWRELRQVHWPNRRATWGLTAAVLAFSAFFVVFILLLDALFKFLFELILK